MMMILPTRIVLFGCLLTLSACVSAEERTRQERWQRAEGRLEAARAYARSNRSLETSLAIDRVSAELQEAEQALLRMRRQAAERSAVLVLVLGAVGIPLSLGILGWVYLVLSREVRERMLAESRTAQLNAVTWPSSMSTVRGAWWSALQWPGMITRATNSPTLTFSNR